MPTLRIPLLGSMTTRDGTNTLSYNLQKDQIFQDCDFQIVNNKVTGKVSTWVRARNDFKESDRPTGASGQGTCVYVWRGRAVGVGAGGVVSAFGSTNSTIYVGTASIGSITGQCHFMSEAMVGTTSTMLMISNFAAGGSNRAWFYPESGALTEITDTDFPAKQTPALTMVGNFVSLDGFNFIMTFDGQIWHSDSNSIANWSATSYVDAEDYPGVGVGLARHGRYVAAFKRKSIEFFQNTGNAAGSVLSRVSDHTKQVGCESQYSIRAHGGGIFFVGSEGGRVGVYHLLSMEVNRISTPEVESLFSATSASESTLGIFTSYGKPYLVLMTSRGAATGYAYDLDSSLWHLWNFSVAPYAFDSYSFLGSDATMWSTFYVSLSQQKVYVNDKTPVQASIQTGVLDFGSANRKTMTKIRLVGDKTTSSMPIAVSWSDDDYQNFSTPRNIDMSLANPQLMRCGTFRRRAFKFTGLGEASTDRPARLEAIDVSIYESDL